MNENEMMESKSTQGPICSFCYKWCPRLLLLMGLFTVISALCFCCFDLSNEIYSKIVGEDEIIRARLNGFKDPLTPKLIIPYLYYCYQSISGLVGSFCYNIVLSLTTLLTVITSILKIVKANI